MWFADRAGAVTSIEHDDAWYARIASMPLPSNVSINLISKDSSEYADCITDTHDLVVVDGRRRMLCLERAIPHVRPGGLLLLDDSDRARYHAAEGLVPGWPGHVFRGLAPFRTERASTTIWIRP